MKLIYTFLLSLLFLNFASAQSSSIVYKSANGQALAKDLTLTNPIKLDPNVVKDFLKVSVDPALGDVKKTIAIYDILGREVLMQVFEGLDKQLYIQNLSRGLYFIRIDTPDLAIVSKFEISQ